jgi:hypothetical protein
MHKDKENNTHTAASDGIRSLTYGLKVRYATYTRDPPPLPPASVVTAQSTTLYYGKEPKILGGADNTM